MNHRNELLRGACHEFEQELVLYYYGECGGDERKKVEKHLEGCSSCQRFLADLCRLLPLTINPDEPPQLFWESYSKEMQRKLAAAAQKRRWWRELFPIFRPWPVPALATALVLILALTLTFGKRIWRLQDFPPEEEAVLEILPMAENIEFFKAMDLLDSLDLLEASGGLGNGST
jgi:hypothetical protein